MTFLQRSFFNVAVQFSLVAVQLSVKNDVRTAEKRMLQCNFCSATFRKLQRNFCLCLWDVAGVGFRGVGLGSCRAGMAWKTAKSRKWKKKWKSKWKTAPSWTGAKMAKEWRKKWIFEGVFHDFSIFGPFFCHFCPCPAWGRFPFRFPFFFHFSESVKCRFSKCRFSVLNLKFDFISDGGRTREKQIQKALGSLPPCGNRCRFSESAICSSRVHPPSEIKSNFKFKTLRWRLLRWRLTLSEFPAFGSFPCHASPAGS